MDTFNAGLILNSFCRVNKIRKKNSHIVRCDESSQKSLFFKFLINSIYTILIINLYYTKLHFWETGLRLAFKQLKPTKTTFAREMPDHHITY